MSHQWYNLDSNLEGPTRVSDMYLGMLLAQLANEGVIAHAGGRRRKPCGVGEGEGGEEGKGGGGGEEEER